MSSEQNQVATAGAQSPVVNPLRPSANGYLVTDPNGATHHASWAAPYFVLECVEEWDDHGTAPVSREWSLCHCDDLAHARNRLALADPGSRILNADFTPLA